MEYRGVFWSSAVLTGNRTSCKALIQVNRFWSSAVLTGNRTPAPAQRPGLGFGAVPF